MDIGEAPAVFGPNPWVHCLPSQHPNTSFESLPPTKTFFQIDPSCSNSEAFTTNPIPPMAGGMLVQVGDTSAPHSFIQRTLSYHLQ